MKSLALIFLLTFILLSSALPQGVPPYPGIRLQGSLTDNAGNFVNGLQSITVRIYETPDGGIPIYTEVFSNLSITNGILDVMVNATTLPYDSLYWVETQLNNEVFAPRTQLASVPYAFRSFASDTAGYAKTIGDSSVTSLKLKNGTIQFEDMAQNGATTGQVIKWNGSAWVAAGDSNGTGVFLPLAGGVMTGAITNTGNPPITMGKGNFGTGNINTGTDAFVAGSGNIAHGDFVSIGGGQSNSITTSFNPLYVQSSTIGGGSNNTISSATATIGGGSANYITEVIASNSTIGGGTENSIYGNTSTISGGSYNKAYSDGSTIGGGVSNTSDVGSVIGGGKWNKALGTHSTIGGGAYNTAKGLFSFIGGGGGYDTADSNSAIGHYSVIGGGRRNTVLDSSATISGGGSNFIYNKFGTISGGTGNIVGNDIYAYYGIAGTVGGGMNNHAWGSGSTVSGGIGNGASSWNVAIGGGSANTVPGVYGSNATIGGGASNSINSPYATIGGGNDNTIGTVVAEYSTIGGGSSNIIGQSYGFIGGGSNNVIGQTYGFVGGGQFDSASGQYSSVPGGKMNKALGEYSLAAGEKAKAFHNGTFVWADNSNTDFISSAVNEFNIRATGGTRIFSDVGLTAGVTLAAGASSWASVSDSTLKRNARLVDGADILDKVSQLPIKQWSYKAQDASIEHVGPMAQDFYSLFQLGDNDKTISTIDPSGIALAAIQQLHKENIELKQRLTQLEALIKSLAKSESRDASFTQNDSR